MWEEAELDETRVGILSGEYNRGAQEKRGKKGGGSRRIKTKIVFIKDSYKGTVQSNLSNRDAAQDTLEISNSVHQLWSLLKRFKTTTNQAFVTFLHDTLEYAS